MLPACFYYNCPTDERQFGILMMVFPSGPNQEVVQIYTFCKCGWINTYPPQQAALELDTTVREGKGCGDRKKNDG